VIAQLPMIVRSKLLDFMLKLEKEFGIQVKIKDLISKDNIINQIINKTIFASGDGNDIENKITIEKVIKCNFRKF